MVGPDASFQIEMRPLAQRLPHLLVWWVSAYAVVDADGSDPPAVSDADLRCSVSVIGHFDGTPVDSRTLKRPLENLALIWDARRARHTAAAEVSESPDERVVTFRIGPDGIEPRVRLLRCGQTLEIHNATPVEHAPLVSFVKNPPQGPTLPLTPPTVFRRRVDLAERGPVPVRCAVHDADVAWLIVQDHPFMAVADLQGQLRIENLPTGRQRFRVWHPDFGNHSVQLRVSGTPAKVTRGYIELKLREGVNEIPLTVVVGPTLENKISDYDQQIEGTDLAILMVGVPGGEISFRSGTSSERPQEAARIQRFSIPAFWIGKYELRYEEYAAWADDRIVSKRSAIARRASMPLHKQTSSFSGVWNGPHQRTNDWPAVGMTQWSARRYCHWLSMMTGRFYRLPTEAEWELACRGGQRDSIYPWGDDFGQIDQYAVRFAGPKFADCLAPVGTKQPNGYGILDMIGNVEEWVVDGFDPRRDYRGSQQAVIWPVSDHLVQQSDSFRKRLEELGEPFISAWGVAKGGSHAERRDQRPESFSISARTCPNSAFNLADPGPLMQDSVDTLPPLLGEEKAIGFRIVRPVVVPARERQLWHWGVYDQHDDRWLELTLPPS